MKTHIEGALPLRMINQSAMTERAKKEHPGNMHLWWNRSPIEASKELIKAAVASEVSSSQICESTIVVDPFSGFGGLVLAAVESGCSIVAGDLNSIATVLTKAAAEIPARFAEKSAVAEYAENRIYTGTLGLAEDVRCYGREIRERLADRLEKAYPESINNDGRKTYAWIWTRTVTCPNPACGCRMPLASSYVLSRLKGREYYAQPEVVGNSVSFRVHKGIAPDMLQGNKIGSSGAKFRCPACGVITTDEYVKSMGKEHQIGLQLMAVGYEGSDGREYVSPDENHLKAANVDMPLDLPVGELPNNTRWFSPPLFGMKSYADLYSPRQLLLMTTLCDLVCEIRSKIQEDAIKAGMPDDGISLAAGGVGALAYSEAVSVYLAFVVDKLANFQSEICTWDNRNGNIRAAFTRQAIPMTWVFAEGNPFSSVTGNYDTMLEDVVRSIRNLPCKTPAKVMQGDGTRMKFPQNSVLFTELPYYDNVGYADLSDYFYVWMRRCLKDVYPELFEKVVTSKEELSSIPEHYDGDAAKAKEAYEDGIRRLCMNFSEAASSEYPSMIFYEFGRTDEEAMLSETAGKSAWENILEALIQTGFQISAVLPVRTEKPKERYETVRVCIVFRKKPADAPQATRRGFVSELKRELPYVLAERFRADMDDWDRPIVGMGCGLSLFTRYKKIINADGTNMSVQDALKVIWTEVTGYIRETEITGDSSENEEDRHAGEL